LGYVTNDATKSLTKWLYITCWVDTHARASQVRLYSMENQLYGTVASTVVPAARAVMNVKCLLLLRFLHEFPLQEQLHTRRSTCLDYGGWATV